MTDVSCLNGFFDESTEIYIACRFLWNELVRFTIRTLSLTLIEGEVDFRMTQEVVKCLEEGSTAYLNGPEETRLESI